MRRVWLFVIFVVLVGCAPGAQQSAERVAARSTPATVSYYPAETGATWSYLPSGARLSDPPVEVTIDGPTIVDETVATAWTTFGRGRVATHFRIHQGGAQYLWREYRPGVIIEFDPPLLEFAAERLASGSSWSGETTVRVFADQLNETGGTTVGKELLQTYTVAYETSVVETRTVNVPFGDVHVFVLSHVAEHHNEAGEIVDRVSKITWFSPHLGEVRSGDGLLLTSTNVPHTATGEGE